MALNPQRSRYNFIWDPSSVIVHLVTLYPYEDLSLRTISRKLVTFLALTTAQKLQTLAAIQLSNITFRDSLIIKIPVRLKTSGIGRPQPLLAFKLFVDKPELHFLINEDLFRPYMWTSARELRFHLHFHLHSPPIYLSLIPDLRSLSQDRAKQGGHRHLYFHRSFHSSCVDILCDQ